MSHQEAALLAAGAALDDLDPSERAAFDAHAAACADCRMIEDELATVLADLVLVVPERRPPADLLAGIRHAIAAEDERAGAADGASGDPVRTASPTRSNVVPFAAARSRRLQRVASASIGIAAALALVAVGFGARTAGLQAELERSSAQVAALQAQVTDQGGVVLAAMNPGHVSVPLHAEALAPQADALVMFVPGSTSAYLVAEHLPATPAGTAYQLWYADDAGVHPLQTVPFDGDGTFVAPLGVDLADGTAVMVTLEDAGGSHGDPGPQVVFGEL